MRAVNKQSIDTHTEADQRGNLFRLSLRQLCILVGFIGSGLLIYALEEAALSVVVDLVWIVGYGTTLSSVWVIWIRPLDPVGSSRQDTSLSEESDPPETTADRHHGESEASATVEFPAQDSTSTKGDTSQVSTQEHPETSYSQSLYL